MTLDPQIANLLALYAQNNAIPGDAAGLRKVTAAQMRAAMRGPSGPPLPPERVRDLQVPHPAGHTIPLRLHLPGDRMKNSPWALYVHGGGWATGDNDTHAAIAAQLAGETGFVVAAVDYRLAPEHPFPAGLDDCWTALRWTVAQARDLDLDPTRIALVGDSAGGNLATVMAIMARDVGGPAIAFQALIYPCTDTDFDRWPSMRENGEGYMLTRAMLEWFHRMYFHPREREDPRIAPIRTADLAGLPPALVIVGEYDPLRDEGEAYAGRLQDAGVPVTLTRYPGQVHGFFRLPDTFDGARAARLQVAKALREALA